MLTRLYPLVTEKSWKSLLVQNDRLFLMNFNHTSEEDFLESYRKKSIFKQKKEIDINAITSFSHPENKPVRLNITATSGKVLMDFANTTNLQEVVAYLQQQRKFTSETKGVSTFRALTPSLIGLGLTALFTFIIYEDALTLEEGGYVSTSGRRALFKQLFAWLAEQLGSRNTLIVGGGIAIICLYFMYKAFRNPPNEVVYQ